MRHPKFKNIEKWWLRKAFENTNILPNEVLWRKKEAFSDGISSTENSWYQIIQNNINEDIIQDNRIIQLTPTKEAAFYAKIFIKHFGEKRLNIIPQYWQPKFINKNGDYVDPSARTLNVY
jgi:asparagine synthase (glutamine-hydrolysing)